MAPYSTGPLAITVSCLNIDKDKVAKVKWSETKNGTKRSTGSTVTLPSALAVANTQLLFSEVSYSYKPTIGHVITGTLTLSFSYYLAHGTNSSTADFLRVFVVGTTTSQVFQELGGTENDNGVWATGSANISSFAGQTVRIRIEAADASTASLVEAGIDDVVITQQ